MRGAAVLLLLAALPGCGSGETDPTAETWRKRGEASFFAADQLMERVDVQAGTQTDAAAGVDRGTLRAEAVAAYVEAANGLIRAFRLEDPLPELREKRAMTTFRIGRALSNASRHGVAHPRRDHLARRSVFWFGEALGLMPTLHAAEFERAVLYDSEIAAVRDLYRARDAYARFLRVAPTGAAQTPVFARLQEIAERRQAALTKELGLDRDD